MGPNIKGYFYKNTQKKTLLPNFSIVPLHAIQLIKKHYSNTA